MVVFVFAWPSASHAIITRIKETAVTKSSGAPSRRSCIIVRYAVRKGVQNARTLYLVERADFRRTHCHGGSGIDARCGSDRRRGNDGRGFRCRRGCCRRGTPTQAWRAASAHALQVERTTSSRDVVFAGTCSARIAVFTRWKCVAVTVSS